MSLETPYAPPKAPLATVASPVGSTVKALLVGTTVDIVGTFVLQLVVGASAGLAVVAQGGTEADVRALLEQGPLSLFSILLFISGCFASAFGGYLCGRIAKRWDYRLAVGMAVLSASIGLILNGVAVLAEPARLLLSVLVTMVSALLGAFFAVRRRRLLGQS